MRSFTTILCFSLLAICSSCKVFFDQSIRERIQKSNPQNIEKVQFYNNTEIELVYESTTGDEEIRGGKVKIEDGIYYYHVRIPLNTPAVARHIDDSQLMLFFEEGEDRFLVFKKVTDPLVVKETKKGVEYDEDSLDRYVLSTVEKDEDVYVSFEDKEMKVVRGKQALLLMKKVKKFVDVDSDKRRVKGVKL